MKALYYQLLGLNPEMLDFKPPESSNLKVVKTNFNKQLLTKCLMNIYHTTDM